MSRSSCSILASLLMAGCGGDVVDDGCARWIRASFQPLAAKPEPKVREVARFGARDFTSAWRVGREGHVAEPLRWMGTTPEALALSGEGARLAELPVALTAAHLHRATLELDVPDGQREAVRLALETRGRTRAYSDVVTIEGGAGPELVEVDLGEVRELEGGFDAVVLETLGTSTTLAVLGLAFSRQSELSLLPTPHDEPALVRIRDEARLGVALDAEHPLALLFSAPEGAAFELSYRVGPATLLEDATLVLTGLGATPTRLPLGVAPRYEWRTFRQVLTGSPDRELRVALEGGPATALTLVADAGARSGTPSPTPRTVLLVTSDTHRGELLGTTGGGLVRTPALDALAARGVVFLDAMSTSNATNPSHAALMTGLHPRDTRVVTNRDPLARRAVTLAERFAAAGYRTAATYSAFHLDDSTSGLGQGFDRYDGPAAPTGLDFDAFEGAASSVRDGALTIERALAYVDDAEGAPLFLWVHLFDAHAPYLPEGTFHDRYQPPGKDPRVDGPGLPVPPRKIPAFLSGVRDPEYPWRQYRALVDYVDHVLTPLLERPRIAAGVIGFTSDHGESFGERGIWWNHAGVHAATTHVPLLLTWPGAEAARVAAPVRQSDLGHTLLALAGLDAEDFDGRDLRWALEPGAAHSPRYSLGYHARSASLDDGRWLLVLHLAAEENDEGTRAWRPGEVELFDRRNDPRCDEDLVEIELDRARAMRARLLQWLASADPVGYKGEFHVKAAIDRALEALGYATGGEIDGAWYDPSRGDAFSERFGER